MGPLGFLAFRHSGGAQSGGQEIAAGVGVGVGVEAGGCAGESGPEGAWDNICPPEV